LFINKQKSLEQDDFTKQILILKICFNFLINPLNIICSFRWRTSVFILEVHLNLKKVIKVSVQNIARN